MLTDVEGRRAKIGGPDGISNSFHIMPDGGEPFAAIFASNLLSKDNWRAALGDEAVKSGPQVAFVGMAFPESSDRKRLTWTGACPAWFLPSCEVESKRPSSDSCEEVALIASM